MNDLNDNIFQSQCVRVWCVLTSEIDFLTTFWCFLASVNSPCKRLAVFTDASLIMNGGEKAVGVGEKKEKRGGREKAEKK